VTGNVNQPYQVRALSQYEIVDSCPAKDDIVPFRIPLRGLPNLTPTLKNVFNKFSVRYYLKCVLTELREDHDPKSKAAADGELKEYQVTSSLYELNFWR
jgi:hypothetical protein